MSAPNRTLVVSSLVLALLASGCSMFRPAKKTLADQVEESFDGPSYVLMVEKNGRKTRRRMKWQEGMTLQDVVSGTGLNRRLAAMDLMIKRPTDQAHVTIPLESKYDKRKRRVEPAFDYAVHPRDFVLVQDASKGMIDELIDSAIGGFIKK